MVRACSWELGSVDAPAEAAASTATKSTKVTVISAARIMLALGAEKVS
jgi:hypothetical protein